MYLPSQGGGTSLQFVLRAATVVKILTEKILYWHCIYFTIVYFVAEILLGLDQLDHVYQRNNL